MGRGGFSGFLPKLKRGFMFNSRAFTPIGGQTIRHAPTFFSYKTEDTFKEVLSEGYFNENAIMLSPGDRITIVCVDEIVDIFIKAIEGLNVILDDRMIKAIPVSHETAKRKEITPKRKKAA